MNKELDNGVSFSGDLPIQIEAIDEMPQVYECMQISESNAQFLNTVLILNEKLEIDESEEINQELKKQDLKISLLLDMMSSLLIQNKVIPAERPVHITLDNIRFMISDSAEINFPDEGQLCRITLYIEASIPKPIILFGNMMKDPEPEWKMISLTNMDEEQRDSLHKFIFRHHRRQIALRRKF